MFVITASAVFKIVIVDCKPVLLDESAHFEATARVFQNLSSPAKLCCLQRHSFVLGLHHLHKLTKLVLPQFWYQACEGRQPFFFFFPLRTAGYAASTEMRDKEGVGRRPC